MENRICFELEEVEGNAIKEMENCMAYMTVGNMERASMCYGSAAVWDSMYNDMTGNFLEDQNEHYGNMTEIWLERKKNNA